MKLRDARMTDAEEIHLLGTKIPELRVHPGDPWMSLGEVKDALLRRLTTQQWIVAQHEGRIVGFICCSIGDPDGATAAGGWACLVYLAIAPAFRRRGLATVLWTAARRRLHDFGIRHVYTWAHPTSGVVPFFERHGFRAGTPRVYMDVEIDPSLTKSSRPRRD